jgi:hypothetical protein
MVNRLFVLAGSGAGLYMGIVSIYGRYSDHRAVQTLLAKMTGSGSQQWHRLIPAAV